jgi:lysyl oxidase
LGFTVLVTERSAEAVVCAHAAPLSASTATAIAAINSTVLLIRVLLVRRGGGKDATQTMMGLSPGWGDRYNRTLPDQYIDVTGLTSGRYRLRLTADADDWFQESNNANNESWVIIRLRANAVSIVRYGPSA